MTTAIRRPGRRPVPAERFDHGDPRRYRRGCRCRPCTTAVTREGRQKAYLRATGRGGKVGPERAAAHIQRLRAAGMADTEIIAAAQIPQDTLYRAVRHATDLYTTTEARILAVRPPEGGGAGSGACIDSTGTVRRIQALIAAGWPQSRVADHLGWDKVRMYQILTRSSVTGRVAAAVRDAYDQLATVDPTTVGVHRGVADRARRRAERHGWPDPTWWEDWGGIDDPGFDPGSVGSDAGIDWVAVQRGGDPAATCPTLTEAELREAGRILRDRGVSICDTAARLGVTERTVARWRTAGARRRRELA